MNTYRRILALVTVGALMLGGAGYAQNQPGGQVQEQAQTVPAEAMNVDTLRTALENLQTEIDALQGATQVEEAEGEEAAETEAAPAVLAAENVQLIGIQQMEGAQDAGIDTLLSQNQQQLQQLHQILLAMPAVVRALSLQNIAMENVVAINMTEAGQLWVYHQQEIRQQAPTVATTETQAQQVQTGGANVERLQNLLTALTNMQAEIAELKLLTDVPAESIQFVNVTELKLAMAEAAEPAAVMDVEDLNQLYDETLEQREQLLQELDTNEAVLQALEQQGLATEHVVAVDVNETGEVVIFWEEAPEPADEQNPEAAQPEVEEEAPEGGN